MIDVRAVQLRLRAKGYVVSLDGVIGPETYTALLAAVGNVPIVQMHRDLGKAAAAHFPAADITTPLRLAHCLAQSSVETAGFTRLVENLNYRASALISMFGRHRISVADANKFGRTADQPADQQALANILYGGKFGRDNLGNTQPGDGWRYRGRGTKQTTGRANYTDLQAVTGLNVIDDPDQLADPDKGLRAGCVYWEAKGCNAIADRDDIEALTKWVNGGLNGIVDRKAALARAKSILL